MMEDLNKSLLTQEKLSLKSWGLPRAILEKYSAKGIENMFLWQVECLTCDGVLSGRNLVYSAPTSAGKTMVAEIITIQTVLERKKKVIFILPFVSVVREKMLYFQNLLGSSGVRVEGFMGSHAPPGGLRTVHIAVCTIEKANSLINRLLEDQGLDAVGCVVVDELHLLGDTHRGYLLELLLTKLKFMCRKDKTLNIQVVGMSATLPNVGDLATWLDAALYTTQFRPIPLTEYLKVNSSVYDASTMELKYNIEPITKFKSDPGDVIHLCLESLLAGHSVLVFCPTRSWCETSAQQIAAEFRRIGYEKSEMGQAVREQLDGGAISDVLEQLKRSPAGLDPSLGRSVAFGVAFHHAGLTMDERDIVEGAFRNSVLRVLVATSTLSSGVNLPARRVLIRCPPRNMGCDVRSYRQMVGRAGRMGKDTAGESFLICNGSERCVGEQLVRSELPPVESSLGVGDLSSSLKRALLEVIASGVVNTPEDVELYTGCTFLASSSTGHGNDSLADPVAACVDYLQTNEFIRVSGGSLGPTPLAEACLSASLPPDQGLKLLKELHRARQCFVLETELHVIYQVTPYSVSDQWGELDWLRVLSLWEDLPISMKRVGELVGVEERFLVGAVRGTLNMKNSAQKLSIHRRFYTALALQDLVNEVPLPQVAVKFACSKGVLQSLQQSASTFAGMVTQFTRRLGWSNVELLVSQFSARLQFGAQRELLDLLRLDCLTAVQARALYNNGIQALADLATAGVGKVERALARATPFQSELEGDGQGGSDKCCIWLVGRCAVTETQAADILIQEARQYLERELGLQSANWGDLNTSVDSSASVVSLTQDVDTPPRPIGQDIKGNVNNEKGKIATVNENNVEEKQEEEKHSTSEVRNTSPINIVDKISSESENKEKCQTNLAQGEINFIKKERKTLEHDGSSKNMVLKSDFGTPLNAINNVHRKRGSLDLFDSPDQAVITNMENSKAPDENIVGESHNLNNQNITKLQTPSNKETLQRYVKGTDSKESHLDSNHLPRFNYTPEPGCSKDQNISSDKEVGSRNFGLMSVNIPLCLENIFDDSQKERELNDALLDKLDANLGGESLLEMSSFVSETDEVLNADILCSNKGKHSQSKDIWEMSSLVELTQERKRKHSIDNKIDRKRLKVHTPKSTEPPHKTLETNELQVSQITSTNSNVNPIKTSTPTLSQYFEGSINFDSPFSLSERANYPKINGDNVNDDLFVDSNENIAGNENINPSIDCGDEKSLSFELKVSDNFDEDESVNDCDLNVDSKILVELDSKIDSFPGNQDSPISTSLTTEKINNVLDKPLTSLKNVNADSKFSENDHVKFNKRNNVVEANSFNKNVNMCLFQDSFVIDSKLNALIEMKDTTNTNIATDTNRKNSDNFSQFSGSLCLNSELCDLLEGNISKKDEDGVKKCDEIYSNQFEMSGFIINTQVCNIIDDVVRDENHEVGSKSLTNAKSNWTRTESMEVNEIQNLDFDDEDTVFGTPVSHHKSLFKKPDGIKTKRGKTIVVTKNAADHVAETSCQQLVAHPLQSDANKNCKTGTEVLPQELDMRYSSITESFLECAFEKSFSQAFQDAKKDSFVNYQKTPPRHHSPLKERCGNVESPAANKSRSQVEVVTVSDTATRQDFRSRAISCKCVSLVLTTRSSEADGNGRRIGAKIVSKTSENSFPCCCQDQAVTSAVVCWGNSSVYVVTLDKENCAANLEVLREMVSRKDLVICCWEAKRTVQLLRQCCQLQCDARLSDPTIAEWLLKPHQHTPTLKQMARSYGVQAPQCSVDASFTALLVWELCTLLKAKLKQTGLYKSYKEVEMPTQPVLAEMEVEGVSWDREYVESLWTATEDKMADLQTRLYTVAGRKFNLRSRTDLTKVEKYIMESCDHKLEEFKKVLRNWRVLNSLKARNMSPLLMLGPGRVRGCWDTHTVTGRISMQEPSLQHVPRDITIDDQVFSLRSSFVASPGSQLVSADYSQLELRLLAHFSQDPALLETFRRPGDVFTAIAAEWHDIPQQQVGEELRHHTKQLCYGLIYGMGPATLAEEMGVEVGEAEGMAASFHQSYPGLPAYVGRCVAACRASTPCHVTTLLGRRRYLPDINSNNKALRAQAERQAVNTTIQGSAADIAKTAMLRVRQAAKKHGLTARLIIHLHDELIYEVAQQDVNDFTRVLRKEMEGAVALSVPLPVKVKKGPSWGQLELID